MMFNRNLDKGPIDLSGFNDGDKATGDLEDDLEAIYEKKDSTQINKTETLKPYTILANVYMSRYLVPGDNSGTSDPYVNINYGSQKKTTKVKNNCVNGIWNETLFLDDIMFDIDDKDTRTIIQKRQETSKKRSGTEL